MFWIITLLVVGLVLFFVELVLLPGVTVAAVGAFVSLVAAVSMAFMDHGNMVGLLILAIALLMIIVMMTFFLRAKTWRKLTLNTELKETISAEPTTTYAIGQSAICLTRLAPMGKVQFADGSIVEARSLDSYIDPKSEVEIIGFENSYVIVKLK